MPSSYEISKFRLLHNVTGAPNVDVFLDETPYVRNLAYKETTLYLKTRRLLTRIQVRLAGTNTVIVRSKIRLEARRMQTLIITGLITDLSSIAVSLFRDKSTCPKPGSANLRFIQGAAGAPAVDVYVADVKTFSNVGFNHTGNPTYVPVQLGRVNISVNLAGTATVVIPTRSYYLISGGVYTFTATGLVSSGLSLIFNHDNTGSCEQLQPNFNIQNYMGLWYQIANIPSFFDLKCGRSSATYTPLLRKSGTAIVGVYNVCYNNNWEKIEDITGTATVVNCNPAALRVLFPSPPPPAPPIVVNPGANYLVHETDYLNYAIVGSPTRVNFFILARTKTISKNLYDKLLEKAIKLGYDPTKIVVNYRAVVGIPM